MSRVIADLHPDLQVKIAQLKERCQAQGLPLLITDCVRNREEQADCVKRGASRLQYPYSMHNWGVAFDFARNVKGQEYDDSDGFFGKVGAIGKKYGLIWGGDWKSHVDKPHLQLATWGTGTGALREIYGTPEKFKEYWPFPNDGQNKEDQEDVKMVNVQVPLLKTGSRGESVKLVQYIVGAETDGIYGTITANRVRLFQQKHGLGIDGIVGAKTWGKLLNN